MSIINTHQQKKQVVSKDRVTNHGEVYTGQREVNSMLEMVGQETERIDSRFLEPACGTGNFLTEILERKLNVVDRQYNKDQLDYERYSVLAISSIYGIDILEDNVKKCRNRLFNIFDSKYRNRFKRSVKEKCLATVKFVLEQNIVHGDALTYKSIGEKPTPIVFSEWSLVNNVMLKRWDYMLSFLVEKTHQLRLFNDENEEAFLDKPVKEYPLVHFLEVGNDIR